jgi:hypothetical protein
MFLNFSVNSNRNRKYFRVLIRGLDGIVWRKNRGSKISWHGPFKWKLSVMVFFQCFLIKKKPASMWKNKIPLKFFEFYLISVHQS